MPWVRFTAAFDWAPPERNGRFLIAYKPGRHLVTRACAEAAIAAGKAASCARPREAARTESETDAG